MVAEVAIVMPYFQRQEGILRNTVRKVFEQRDCPAFNLIIVDDGSPVPAVAELAGFNEEQRAQITLIHQDNRGVTAACNTGLAAVPSSAVWIARLDSDDHWDPDHLARAVMMMRAGFDFFFANEQGAESVPRLQAVGFWPSEHVPRDEGLDLYEMRNGAFLNMILQHAQVCSSTVVMRRAKFTSLRYRQTLAMCEDLHFFLDIALQVPKVAFSTKIHATHGPGVHMNQVADWKTNRALRAACDFTDYYGRILQNIALTSMQASTIRQRYVRSRRDVAAITLAMIKAGRMPDARLIGGFGWQHPLILKDFARVVSHRIAGAFA